MAFIAGLGGPAGMAAFGAWTYYRRVHPMVKAYREEARVNPQMKNFWQYMKEHKKDTLMAGLYMGSSVASFAIAGAQVASAITMSSTVAQAGAASIAPLTQAKAWTAAGIVFCSRRNGCRSGLGQSGRTRQSCQTCAFLAWYVWRWLSNCRSSCPVAS